MIAIFVIKCSLTFWRSKTQSDVAFRVNKRNELGDVGLVHVTYI